jgi:hypothetical protein
MGGLDTAMHHQGGGGGGGNLGGGRGGSGGRGGRGGGGPAPAPATNPAALVTPAPDIRSMGTLPAIFTGDRTKAQDFLDELRGPTLGQTKESQDLTHLYTRSPLPSP